MTTRRVDFPELIPVGEVAAQLGIGVHDLLRLAELHIVPRPVRFGGRLSYEPLVVRDLLACIRGRDASWQTRKRRKARTPVSS